MTHRMTPRTPAWAPRMGARRPPLRAGTRSELGAIAGPGPRPRWRRALTTAAALAIIAVPWLSARSALAAAPEARAVDEAPAAHDRKAPANGKVKKKGKGAAKKPAGHGKAKGEAAEAKAQAAEAKAQAGEAKGEAAEARPRHSDVKGDGAGAKRDSKKTAARGEPSKRRPGKKGAKAAAPKPCLGPAISIDRVGLETERVSLLDCAGKPREEAQQRLSVLARPWGAARPSALPERAPKKAARGGKGMERGEKPHGRGVDPAEIAPSVRLLDPGLLSRIDALARRYPGKAISLVSGYRPQSRGSLHQSARAVDLRIGGVRNEELAAACRALPDTGCGYYPNSSFVHVDVRAPGTGTASWIDASGPGEAPRYVTAWPPPAEEGSPGKPGDAAGAEVAGAVEAHDDHDDEAADRAAAGDGEGAPAREAEVDREPARGEPATPEQGAHAHAAAEAGEVVKSAERAPHRR